MARKLVSLLLVVSMVFCLCTSCANKQEPGNTTVVEVDGVDITVVETDVKREVSATIEDVPVKCEYILGTDECWLYLDEEPIKLRVVEYDDFIEVFLPDEVNANYDEEVVGQFVLTVSLATKAFLAFAATLLTYSIAPYAKKSVYIAADALGNVIGGIRYNTNTYYRYRTIDISAADAIRFGRISKGNYYYPAYLSGNTVMISIANELSVVGAISRLEMGYDVFATSEFAAMYACAVACTNDNRGKPLTRHTDTREGYYPHYHPLGRRWYKNRNYAPHCWYPYN